MIISKNWFKIIITSLLIVSLQAYSQNCSSVQSKSLCLLCQNHFFFDQKCVPCLNASSEYNCQLCPGFYFRQGKCQPCSQTTNPGQCIQCIGYFFTSGKCLSCSLANSFECVQQCQGYHLNRGICTSCTETMDKLTCKYCNGIFEFTNNSCVKCPTHYTTNFHDQQCLSCAGINSQIMCNKCQEFYFINKTCKSCSSAKQSKECSLCPGFYFNANSSTCIHCNDANQSDCSSSCKAFVFSGGFCVPCKLVTNRDVCSKCQLFSFNQKQKLCIPCQKIGQFISQFGTCELCTDIRAQQYCQICLHHYFDRQEWRCKHCDNATRVEQCLTCPQRYFEIDSMRCLSCQTASSIQCQNFCADYFFNGRCTKCNEASSKKQCRKCSSNYFWSAGNQCMRCNTEDFFILNGNCNSCLKATQQQCKICKVYFYDGEQCEPCRYANTLEKCNKCAQKSFVFFSKQQKCQLCLLATKQQCTQYNCPGFGYEKGACKPAKQLQSQVACLQNIFMSYTEKGCQYCVRINEYFDFIKQECFKCQSFKNQHNCSKCLNYYFDQTRKTCSSCTLANTIDTCKNCPNFIFNKGNCEFCQLITKKTDCQKCDGYFYRFGQCISCNKVETEEECRKCKKYVVYNQTCIKCEMLLSMPHCQFLCRPLGYFVQRKSQICLSCSLSKTESGCMNCFGHYWNNAMQQCINCNTSQEHCNNCPGKFWNNQSAICSLCSVNNCRDCQQNVCTQCQPTYQLRSNKSQCVKICLAQNCQKCAFNSSQFCQLCLPDYTYLSTDAICLVECQVDSCKTCMSNSICSTCQDGYQLISDGKQCVCSIDGCDTCTILQYGNITSAITVCSRCKMGYFAINAGEQMVCSKINCGIAMCNTCLTNSSCLNCEKGFRISNNKTKCTSICLIKGCAICSTASTCQSCIQNYNLINLQICRPQCQISNCIICLNLTSCLSCDKQYVASQDGLQCQMKCSQGWFWNANSKICQFCSSHQQGCRTCQLINNEFVCNQCSNKYLQMIINITRLCLPCIILDNKCAILRNREDNIANEVICQRGYSRIEWKCKKCSSNCQNCIESGQGKCDQNSCQLGFYTTKTKQCRSCLSGCRTCSTSTPQSCLTCYQRNYLQKNKCIPCPSFCQSCSNPIICNQCDPDRFLHNGECLLRNITHCQQYEVRQQLKRCKKCEFGLLVRQNRCVMNITCQVNSTCVACPPKYYLSAGKCVSCPHIQNCLICNQTNSKICQNCTVGYYLSRNQTCMTCQQGCSTCISFDNCSRSQLGYYLQKIVNIFTGYVKVCPSQCTACNSLQQCFSCSDKFYLIDSRCVSTSAVNLSMTVKPLDINWEQMEPSYKQQILSFNWHVFSNRIFQFIGYSQRPKMVILRQLETGSIKTSLIIDVLSSQNSILVRNAILQSITAKNKDFQLISHQFTLPKLQNVNVETTQTSESNVLLIVVVFVVCVVAIVSVLLIFMKFKASRRVNNSQQSQPVQVKKEEPSNPQGITHDNFKQCKQDVSKHSQIISQIQSEMTEIA